MMHSIKTLMLHSRNTWVMKKRLAPKNTSDNPAAKKDAKGTRINHFWKNFMRNLMKKSNKSRPGGCSNTPGISI